MQVWLSASRLGATAERGGVIEDIISCAIAAAVAAERRSRGDAPVCHSHGGTVLSGSDEG